MPTARTDAGSLSTPVTDTDDSMSAAILCMLDGSNHTGGALDTSKMDSHDDLGVTSRANVER